MTLPYNLTDEELLLEPTSAEAWAEKTLRYTMLNELGPISEVAWDRIMNAATALYDKHSGDKVDKGYFMLACIDTAIVWEFG